MDLIRRRGRDVEGLYMVGASAHPGTGVPICLAGAGLVAKQIGEDFGVEGPWEVDSGVGGGKYGGGLVGGKNGGGMADGKRDERLDKMERPVWLDNWEQWCLIVFLIAVIPWLLMWSWVRWR